MSKIVEQKDLLIELDLFGFLKIKPNRTKLIGLVWLFNSVQNFKKKIWFN